MPSALARPLWILVSAKKIYRLKLSLQKEMYSHSERGPTRVDLLNQIDSVTYEEARPNVVRGRYGNVEFTFIGLAELLKNKKSTPRTKDKGDAEELEHGESTVKEECRQKRKDAYRSLFLKT